MLCAGRVLNCGKTRLGCCITTIRRLTRRSLSAVIRQNTKHPLCSIHRIFGFSPSRLFLFPKLKTTLKGRRFQTIEEIQENAIRELRAITDSAFQEAFQQWKKRWERCIACRGDCFERGQCLKCCKMSNKVYIAKVRSLLYTPCNSRP